MSDVSKDSAQLYINKIWQPILILTELPGSTPSGHFELPCANIRQGIAINNIPQVIVNVAPGEEITHQKTIDPFVSLVEQTASSKSIRELQPCTVVERDPENNSNQKVVLEGYITKVLLDLNAGSLYNNGACTLQITCMGKQVSLMCVPSGDIVPVDNSIVLERSAGLLAGTDEDMQRQTDSTYTITDSPEGLEQAMLDNAVLSEDVPLTVKLATMVAMIKKWREVRGSLKSLAVSPDEDTLDCIGGNIKLSVSKTAMSIKTASGTILSKCCLILRRLQAPLTCGAQ